jgi:hypothetical protein
MNTTRRLKLYNRKDTIYPIQKGGKYGTTMQELKNWYEHMFEKLGWIAISDDSKKVENYTPYAI